MVKDGNLSEQEGIVDGDQCIDSTVNTLGIDQGSRRRSECRLDQGIPESR